MSTRMVNSNSNSSNRRFTNHNSIYLHLHHRRLSCSNSPTRAWVVSRTRPMSSTSIRPIRCHLITTTTISNNSSIIIHTIIIIIIIRT